MTPIIPIVRETDLLFDGQEGEGDLLRYVMAGVGATSKECPEEVLEALRWIVNTEIKDQGELMCLLGRVEGYERGQR